MMTFEYPEKYSVYEHTDLLVTSPRESVYFMYIPPSPVILRIGVILTFPPL